MYLTDVADEMAEVAYICRVLANQLRKWSEVFSTTFSIKFLLDLM